MAETSVIPSNRESQDPSDLRTASSPHTFKRGHDSVRTVLDDVVVKSTILKMLLTNPRTEQSDWKIVLGAIPEVVAAYAQHCLTENFGEKFGTADIPTSSLYHAVRQLHRGASLMKLALREHEYPERSDSALMSARIARDMLVTGHRELTSHFPESHFELALSKSERGSSERDKLVARYSDGSTHSSAGKKII